MWQYPKYITWKRNISAIERWEDFFSPKTAKKIRSAERKLTEAGYIIQVEAITEKNTGEFNTVYTDHLTKKLRAIPHDIAGHIARVQSEGYPIFLITLRTPSHTLHGGAICVLRNDALSIAYRAVPVIEEMSLPIAASYLIEKEFYTCAKEHKKHIITHGKDSNGFGLRAAIGLAEYKRAVGFIPHISSAENNTMLDIETVVLPDVAQNYLFFVTENTQDMVLSHAVIFSHEDKKILESKYPVLFKKYDVQIIKK